MTPRIARPGESVDRMAALVATMVSQFGLDLSGIRVLTEAATGAYSATPVLAALAGADVVALTRESRFGSVAEVTSATCSLADRLGVASRITISTERSPSLFADADIITNSGHVRPISGEYAEAVRPGTALALMFESWEIQAGRDDLALDRLRARGVRIAGTNERHPNVDVFSYLGLMAVVQLADAGIPAYRTRVGLLCDNPFRTYVESGLTSSGATVRHAESLKGISSPEIDVLLVALTPTGSSVLSGEEILSLGRRQPAVPIVQFWGDIDRAAAATAGVPVWPVESPGPGHMGVLPSRMGPDATVRLQAGGLKVGQVLLIDPEKRSLEDVEYLDELR